MIEPVPFLMSLTLEAETRYGSGVWREGVNSCVVWSQHSHIAIQQFLWEKHLKPGNNQKVKQRHLILTNMYTRQV